MKPSAGGVSTGSSIATSNPFRQGQPILVDPEEGTPGAVISPLLANIYLHDRRIIRLIAKWLTAGVLEEGRLIVTRFAACRNYCVYKPVRTHNQKL